MSNLPKGKETEEQTDPILACEDGDDIESSRETRSTLSARVSIAALVNPPTEDTIKAYETQQPQFINRVQQAIPLVNSALEIYDKTKQSSTIIRVGSAAIETGVKRMCEPITKRTNVVTQLDDFACRQLDTLGYGENNNHRKRTKDQAEDNPNRSSSLVGSLVASAKERAVAYGEDSMRRLKYCLDWVVYTTALLKQHIHDIRYLLDTLQNAARTVFTYSPSENNTDTEVAATSGPPGATQTAQSIHQMAVRLAGARKEIVVTVRKAVGVISHYAGSVLPGEARRQVRGLILGLPNRWVTVDTALSQAGSSSAAGGDDRASSVLSTTQQDDMSPANIEATARRTLAFATESFFMLDNLRNVFGNVYANAERWIVGGATKPAEEEEEDSAMAEPLMAYRDSANGSGSYGGMRKRYVQNKKQQLPSLKMTPIAADSNVNGRLAKDIQLATISSASHSIPDDDDTVGSSCKRNRTREPTPT